MRPDRLARQVAHLDQYPAVGCCGGWIRTFGEGPSELQKYPEGENALKAFGLFFTPFAHPSVMFRREWFEREQLRYDGSYYPTEDYELWSRAMFCFPCDNLSRVLMDYRVHAKSMTGGEWSDMDAQTMRVHRQLLARLGIEPSDEEARLHRAASMGLLPPVVESFGLTEAWLLKLSDANKGCECFEPGALADILNYVWFRMTMAVVRQMGSEAWRLYRGSPIAGYGTQASSRRWVVRGAALKAEIMGRRK